MSEHIQSVFTTGEFAKLCNTTKETLFHYDKIGILKPKFIKRNGYRYYSAEQFFSFDTIQVLQKAGSSLEEIKKYFGQYDTEHFLEILDGQKKRLEEKRLEIERMERMLERAIDRTRYALSQSYGEPELVMEEEEYLIVAELGPGEGDHVEGVAHCLHHHFLYCEKKQLVDKFPLGSIIPKENVQAGSDEESYFFSGVSKQFDGERLFKKPAGKYVVQLHKGEYHTFRQAYDNLLKYIVDNHLKICGNAYVYDLVSYLASSIENQYVFKIAIQVE